LIPVALVNFAAIAFVVLTRSGWFSNDQTVMVCPLVSVVFELVEHPASSAVVATTIVAAANAVRDFIIATPL
jgi:hypothetical protein